jgi:hypothetical protein
MKTLFCIVLILTAVLTASDSVQASLSASLGATNLDGLSKFSDCQNQSIGYREGLIADRIELKLANTPNLPPGQRQQWLNDIAILRRVQQTKQVDRTNNQHYLQGLSDQEQVAINSMSVRFSQEVNLKCEQKHGGMLRYSPTSDQSGQTRYEDSLRAQMGTPIDIQTIPVEPLAIERSAAEMEAERKAAQAAQTQSFKQMAAQKTTECLKLTAGLRPKLIAQALQKKLETSNLSPAEKSALQADIQAAWAAAGQGLQMVQSTDPKNPYGVEQRLTPQEHMDINNQYSQQMTQSMTSCAAPQRY